MEKGGPSSPTFPVSSPSSPEKLERPFAIRLYGTSDEDIDDPKKVLFLHGGEYVPDDTVPEFVLEAEAKADPKLKQVRKKLEEVRAQGWRDAHVSIDTSSFDDAYYYLWLTIDPIKYTPFLFEDGYDVRLEDPVGFEPEVDIQYATLLKRLLESPDMSRHLQEREQLKRLKTIATGLSQLTESLMRDCLEDYMLICASEDYLRPFEIVRDQLGKLHEFLLLSDSDAKTQYFSDCEVFKQKLKEMFPNIRAYTPPLLDDEKYARIVFDMRLKYAHDNVENYRRAAVLPGMNWKLLEEWESLENFLTEEKKECTEMDLCAKMQEKMQISGN